MKARGRGAVRTARRRGGLRLGRRLALAASLGLFALLLAALGVAWGATRRVPGQRFVAEGVPLHFTDEGTGPPVVLLHGFAVQADLNWRLPGLTQALARDYRVLAMDLRGHGRSGKPRRPELYGETMARDVVALLDHLDIARAHVAGYSLGGVVALKLAATHPERLRSAAILGAGWEDPRDSVFLAAIEGLAGDLEAGRGIPPLAARLGGDREPPGLLHTAWVRLMTRFLNDGPALAALVRGIRGLAVERAALAEIPVPVLSVVGSLDPMKAGVDAMRGLVPDHRVVYLEGADHMSAVRHPGLQEALLQFLREQEALAGSRAR